MGKLGKTAISFMKELLQLDPKKRLNDDTVFKHPYFADLIEQDRTNKFMSNPNSKRSTKTEENPKRKEHKFNMPSNYSSNSLGKKEGKPVATPLKYDTGSIGKHENKNESEGKYEGKYDSNLNANYHSERQNECSPPKIPINQTANINIINISNINNITNRDKTTSFNYNEIPKEKNPNSKGKNGNKNELNTISMPLNNTMIAFKSIPKTKNPPLTKSTGSTGSPQREYNNKDNYASSNQGMPVIKEAELFKTFFVDQNDKYNFNININFDSKKFSKMNGNKMNYNTKDCNIIYEDVEYGRQEPIYQNKGHYANHSNSKGKKKNYAAFSMYGNFKHKDKDKGFQLPLINFGNKGYGGYKK